MNRPSNSLLFHFFLVTLIFFSCLYPSIVFAHKMLIEHEEDGKIFVRYDDGTPAALAVVTAYDEDGEILIEKEVDENGALHYDSELHVHRIIADDGMGHRASFAKNEKTDNESIPIFIRALLGISILVFIAGIFYYRKTKNEVGK